MSQVGRRRSVGGVPAPSLVAAPKTKGTQICRWPGGTFFLSANQPTSQQASKHHCAMQFVNTLKRCFPLFSKFSNAWLSKPGRVHALLQTWPCLRPARRVKMNISHQNVCVTGVVKRKACQTLSVLAAFAVTAPQSCLRPAGVES